MSVREELKCVSHPSTCRTPALTFSVKPLGRLSNENQVRKGQMHFNLIEPDLLFSKKGQKHRRNIKSLHRPNGSLGKKMNSHCIMYLTLGK